MFMQPDYSDAPHDNILCIDMKSFYASIESVKRGIHPLKSYLAVVGDKNRSGSVVLAASTALKKKYGIKTGSRLYEIPDSEEIIIAEANMQLYLDISMQITELFNSYLPLNAIHIYSIDEAWLNLNGTSAKYGSPKTAAKKIKKDIWDRFSLLCSMGIAPNMFLSKVAMDIEGKKTGFSIWKYEDVPKKLWPLKLSQCWGIGSRIEKKLNNIGVYTIGQLANLPLKYLENKFGIIGNQLYYHAWGIDYSTLEGHYDDRPKNIGRGITLLRDYKEIEEIKTVIFNLSEVVAKRVRNNNLRGKTVSLTVGYSKKENKKGFNHQMTIKQRTNLTEDIYNTAILIFDKYYKGQIVRKITLSLGNFSSKNYNQLKLFEKKYKKIKINKVRDKLAEKMGRDVVYYARNLSSGSIKNKIDNTIGGHKK
jgi:DNA polymerase V